MANKERKYDEDNPNVIAIRRYESEIATLEEKRDKANEEHDWSMRHFYTNQLNAKKANLEILKQKMGSRTMLRV